MSPLGIQSGLQAFGEGARRAGRAKPDRRGIQGVAGGPGRHQMGVGTGCHQNCHQAGVTEASAVAVCNAAQDQAPGSRPLRQVLIVPLQRPSPIFGVSSSNAQKAMKAITRTTMIPNRKYSFMSACRLCSILARPSCPTRLFEPPSPNACKLDWMPNRDCCRLYSRASLPSGIWGGKG